jgi:hypothetical protein
MKKYAKAVARKWQPLFFAYEKKELRGLPT